MKDPTPNKVYKKLVKEVWQFYFQLRGVHFYLAEYLALLMSKNTYLSTEKLSQIFEEIQNSISKFPWSFSYYIGSLLIEILMHASELSETLKSSLSAQNYFTLMYRISADYYTWDKVGSGSMMYEIGLKLPELRDDFKSSLQSAYETYTKSSKEKELNKLLNSKIFNEPIPPFLLMLSPIQEDEFRKINRSPVSLTTVITLLNVNWKSPTQLKARTFDLPQWIEYHFINDKMRFIDIFDDPYISNLLVPHIGSLFLQISGVNKEMTKAGFWWLLGNLEAKSLKNSTEAIYILIKEVLKGMAEVSEENNSSLIMKISNLVAITLIFLFKNQLDKLYFAISVINDWTEEKKEEFTFFLYWQLKCVEWSNEYCLTNFILAFKDWRKDLEILCVLLSDRKERSSRVDQNKSLDLPQLFWVSK